MKKYLILICLFSIIFCCKIKAQNLPNGSSTSSASGVKPLPAAYSGTPKNYLRTFVPQVPISDTSLINMTSAVEDVQTGITYADSYGRTIQSVTRQLSPAKKDNVSAPFYDEFGRGGSYNYPAFVSTSGTTDDGFFKTNPFQQDSIFYKSLFPNEDVIYNHTIYDGSPMNMPVKILAPGNEWVGSNRGKVFNHRSNTNSDSVRYWTIDISSEDDLPATSSYYVAGSLTVEEVTDENGIKGITYKDIAGRLILAKAQLSGSPAAGHTGWLCTYYIYDETGKLRSLIPPKATTALIAVSWNLAANTTIYTGLCFSYYYDIRDRQIMKYIPGKGKSYTAYDLLDRPVMTQDPNLRDSSKWAYVLYDEESRPYKSGIIYSMLTKDSIWAQAARSNDYPTLSGTYIVTMETFYDNYDWLATTGASLSSTLNPSHINSTNFITTYNSSPDYAQQQTTSFRIRGAITGKKTLVLGDTSHLYDLMLYDNFGRTIQTKQINLSGGTDISTVQYSYGGRILRSHLSHGKAGTNSQTHSVVTKYSYDHAGRLLTLIKNTDSTYDRLITTNTYLETGQLSSKVFGNGLETQTYDYNIRGMFTAINASTVTTPGSISSYFGEIVSYAHGFTNAQFNGGISGVQWKTRGDGIERAYGYTYDNANRLTQADYSQQNEGASVWTTDQVDYSVSGLSYDVGGNILSMKQKGLLGAGGNATIDSLTYSYLSNSNRIQKVADGATAFGLGDFKDSTNSNDDYAYDANGNIVLDKNRHMYSSGGNGALFNILDKPDSMAIAGKSCTYYVYDAGGSLLKKTIKDYAKNITNTYTYLSDFVYLNDTLQYGLTEEGRVRIKTIAGTSYPSYDYFIKDHGGNIRAMLTDEGRTDVYPSATMEPADTASQSMYYNNIGSTFTEKPAGYPASTEFSSASSELPIDNNYYVARVKAASGSQKIGPSMVLKVMAGDSFNIKVNSWYKLNSVTPGTPVSTLTDIVGALVSNISGTAALNTHGVSSGDLTTGGFFTPGITDFLNDQNSTTNTAKPKAYLNWVLFDEQFKMVSSNSGFEQVGNDEEAKVIAKTNMPISKCGYLYVYVSNETPNIDVYFDELQVIHKRGPLMETNEYYPYGLQMKHISYRSAGTMQNHYKYNGGNELEDEGELNYHATFFRKYDAQIGRFTGSDMMAEEFANLSPYQFGGNNPVLYNDPMGDRFTLQHQNLTSILNGTYSHENVNEEWHDVWGYKDPYEPDGAMGEGGSGGGGSEGEIKEVEGGYEFSGSAAKTAFTLCRDAYNFSKDANPDVGSVGVITFGDETCWGDVVKIFIPSAIVARVSGEKDRGNYDDFYAALKSISDQSENGIGFLAVFSHGDWNRHAGSNYGEGMIFANASLNPTAANVYTSDLSKLYKSVMAGEIRFASNSVTYFGACNVSSIYKDGKSFAMEFAKASGGLVYGAANAHMNAENPNDRFNHSFYPERGGTLMVNYWPHGSMFGRSFPSQNQHFDVISRILNYQQQYLNPWIP